MIYIFIILEIFIYNNKLKIFYVNLSYKKIYINFKK